jgi:hypothetical protein
MDHETFSGSEKTSTNAMPEQWLEQMRVIFRGKQPRFSCATFVALIAGCFMMQQMRVTGIVWAPTDMLRVRPSLRV